ncbi:hypothetical protein ACFY1U_34580 [Streptomyces sp. NPDC001351]|uniref:hypothetical protein n=1 Tax=unclassified Streptomyces TaxID=2593676 RepID=UPI0036AC4534
MLLAYVAGRSGSMSGASAGTSGTSRPPSAHGSTNIWRIAMAHVERRERRGNNGRVVRSYRVRWRGPDGTERNKSFKRKVDADCFAATVCADLVRGQYVDPDAGKILFVTYARKWLAAQTFDEGTGVAVELRFRLHAFPVRLGGPSAEQPELDAHSSDSGITTMLPFNGMVMVTPVTCARHSAQGHRRLAADRSCGRIGRYDFRS